ncbi:hypothetical protein BNNNBJKE_00025 [Aeromonas phage vB_AdhM_DL]|nr:hypothetical protein BNCALIDO_00079 [Aeromonas phage vB_AdhM_TS9]WBF79609.1 hypothetical protein BNNNBJKE_00025 [Aeromonas phage vB_AdhM_DL]
MTTIIIDEKTKAIYADSQTTTTETASNSSIIFPKNEFKVTTLQPDAEKVFYISKEVGWITATGCTRMLNECVSLSKKNNEFTLPDISKGYRDVKIININSGVGGKIDVIEYQPKTKKVYHYFEKHYWKDCWTRLGTDSILFYGSGSLYAEGAYRACNDPVQAIIAASKCDLYTNANVKVHKLED